MTADAEPVSYVGALALDLSFEDGLTHGRAAVQPEMFAPGTERLRMGVLATLVDMVAGFLPTGPINPTVDLRVSLLARPPSTGTIFLLCHPAKAGRRLFVGETMLHAGDPAQPFARSTVTFMNEPMVHEFMGAPPPEEIRAASFDDLLRPRFRDGHTIEMDAHPWVSNGPAGTIQGGAQALLAEIAAEHALAARKLSVVDLDIRFLNRMRAGPVAATAEVQSAGDDGDDAFVRVAITDVGDDDRLVSAVTLILRSPVG